MPNVDEWAAGGWTNRAALDRWFELFSKEHAAAANILEAALDQVLLRRASRLGSPERAAVIRSICARAGEYFEKRALDVLRQGSPQKRAFIAWHKQALARTGEFASWLRQEPVHLSRRPNDRGDLLEEAALQRAHLHERVQQFEDWLRWVYSASPEGGRPVDWIRADLEESVGNILVDAGLALTTAKDGTYAEVLDAVYHAISLKASPEKAVRTAVRRHPEWRGPNPRRKPAG